MNLKLLGIFSVLVFSLLSCTSEAEKAAERNLLIDSTMVIFEKELYKNQLDSVFSEQKFNGSVSVFRKGVPVYEKSSGFADFTNQKQFNNKTVFAIGSVSKQFTAVLILRLADQGKLQLTDSAVKFVPELNTAEMHQITVAQLLSHTSGINDFGVALQSKPGAEFNYSNKGYRLLGKIVEKLTGKSFESNAQELFRMAGLQNTFTPSNLNTANFGAAFTGNAKQHQKVENMPERLANDDISVAAGGILSTVDDLDIWNRKLYEGNLLKPETLKLMTSAITARPHYVLGTVGYGYGLMNNLGKPAAYFHSGYVKGSPSLNVFYPETSTSVIILSNIADESKGKDAFFEPHARIKKLADGIEISVSNTRKKLKLQ